MNAPFSRIALGTVQFGLPYGVTNTTGQVPEREVDRILDLFAAHGGDTLDTAIAYGDSERVLGKFDLGHFKVISKLPPLPQEVNDPARWVREMVEGSLRRLRINRLYGLLLHRSADLDGPAGEALREGLLAVREAGLVERIGLSIYEPEELDRTGTGSHLVQAPYNVFDRRLEETGWGARLRAANVEVHVRSIFLQGALLATPETLPRQFAPWRRAWQRWWSWLDATGQNALAACLSHALAPEWVGRVVVGVESAGHLAQIAEAAMRALSGEAPLPPPDLAVSDRQLINPSLWPD